MEHHDPGVIVSGENVKEPCAVAVLDRHGRTIEVLSEPKGEVAEVGPQVQDRERTVISRAEFADEFVSPGALAHPAADRSTAYPFVLVLLHEFPL